MKRVVFLLLVFIASAFADIKVLMVATSHDSLGNSNKKTGIWLSELVHAYNEFEKAGFDITISAPKAKPLPIDEGSIKLADSESLEFLTNGEKRELLDSPISLKQAKRNSYDVIYLVGGHGVMWDFAKNSDLKEILVKMQKRKNIISGVCHGAAGLVNVVDENGKSIIDGVKLTGFSNTEESAIKLTSVVPFSLEDELVNAKAIYSKAKKDFSSYVVVDRNFITGQNPASAKQVAQEIVKKFK